MALGDDSRQHLLLAMLQHPASGVRVVDVMAEIPLSRPAVSHHMQVLKNAGLVRSYKKETCVYYYLNMDDTILDDMICLMTSIKAAKQCAEEGAE